MLKVRLGALAILCATAALAYFIYVSEVPEHRFAFKLGLDLRGGSHLVYRADTSAVVSGEEESALESLRDVIERRVNIFGVAEPLVQIEKGGIAGEGDSRLIVELPGVTDINEAIRLIGETPILEFKLVAPGQENALFDEEGELNAGAFQETGLTGRYLKRAVLEFTSATQAALTEPIVRIDFDTEGAKLFSDITGRNVGRQIAIFLDGKLQSSPIVRERIEGGSAIIQGRFTPDEAKELVRNLNFGALPVPIELQSTQSIGATLGEEALNAGVFAGLVGLGAVAIFMVIWYRLPGLVSTIALSTYVFLMLAAFKLIPVTLTAAGVAGLILSIGLAVDANILIAERLKEELRAGRKPEDAIREGFGRAWTSIRDANVTNIISGVILFWFGTALIEGFALVLILGTLVSMISAITVSRTFLLALGIKENGGVAGFLMRSGLRN